MNEGISGAIFHGRLIKKIGIGKFPAVVPEITESAYITGFNHFALDPSDSFWIKRLLNWSRNLNRQPIE